MKNKIKLEKVEVFNLEGAIRGMRNPLNSHNLSDSEMLYREEISSDKDEFHIGECDMNLAKKLIKAGSDHRKFLRQIFISFDLTMPEYFWKQYHTYKVSTTENSTSQMHTLGNRLLTKDDFILDNEDDIDLTKINELISQWMNNKEDRTMWRRIIQLIPQSFLYKKTCTITYETFLNMYNSRKNHKLDEWKWFLNTLLDNCPYSREWFIFNK